MAPARPDALSRPLNSYRSRLLPFVSMVLILRGILLQSGSSISSSKFLRRGPDLPADRFNLGRKQSVASLKGGAGSGSGGGFYQSRRHPKKKKKKGSGGVGHVTQSRVSATSSQIEKPGIEKLLIGSIVQIQNLKKMHQLNNLTGTVVGIGPNSTISGSRIVNIARTARIVELHSNGVNVLVQPDNLQPYELNVNKLPPFSGPTPLGINLRLCHPERNMQTFPPSKSLRELYKFNCSGESRYPHGELMPLPIKDQTRADSMMLRRHFVDVDDPDVAETVPDLPALREAAEVHRQTRRYVQQFIRPGLSFLEIAQRIENTTAFLVQKNGLKRGWGFPTGLSVNHIAAHDSPNYQQSSKILKYSDVLKIDFGVQVNGWIIDSAFSITFDPRHLGLLYAVRNATEAGIRAAGPGVPLSEVGAAIQEAMEDRYTVLASIKDAKKRKGPMLQTVRIRCVQNLCGHNMKQYVIHSGKSVPSFPSGDHEVMEMGEVYAIEVFGTTGIAYVEEKGSCSHYMWNKDGPPKSLLHQYLSDKPQALRLAVHIQSHYSTLAFCRRWLDDAGFKDHLPALDALCDAGFVERYPPLCDREGSFVAQFEHTIYLGPNGKEIISRGEDY